MNTKTVVRCYDMTIFEIDSVTLEPKRCSRYDPYCFIDPAKGVAYMNIDEWQQRIAEKRLQEFEK